MPFRCLTLGNVLDLQEDEAVFDIHPVQPSAMNHQAHRANRRNVVLEFEAVDLVLLGQYLVEECTQSRDVPVTNAKLREPAARDLVGRDLKGSAEGTVDEADPEISVEHDQGPAHVLEDALGEGVWRGRCLGLPRPPEQGAEPPVWPVPLL
jgi:hypothetical protein